MVWVWVELFHSDKRGERYSEHDIAIIAGVVNFLPHPNPPRSRGPGVRNL